MTNSFFLYARKSTDDSEHQIRSIKDQLAELRSLAEREQIHIVEVLVEKQSAKVPGRPIFNEMLNRIEAGEADGILAWHPDRLARNAIDGGRVVDAVDRGHIRHLRFPTYWFEPTPQGKFMLSIAFGQSKYYVDSLSENIRRAQRQKVAAGQWCWQAPVGYLNDPKTKSVVLDPAKAPIVHKAFELYATGRYTFRTLRDTINALNLKGWRGKPLSTSNYHELLNNPFYYGTMRIRGELYEGAHEPLIKKKLFDKCRAVMERASKPNSPHVEQYVFRGMLRCGECGCTVTMERQKGHIYLRCTKCIHPCSQSYVREESVVEQIRKILSSYSLPDDCADWMLEQLGREAHDDAADDHQFERDIEQRIKKLDVRLDRLMSAYLDGAFASVEYRKKKQELIDDKQELKENLADVQSNRKARFEPAISFINRSKQAKFVAQGNDLQNYRVELETIGSNLRLIDGKLVLTARAGWDQVANQRFSDARRTPALPSSAGNRAENPNLVLWSVLLDSVRTVGVSDDASAAPREIVLERPRLESNIA